MTDYYAFDLDDTLIKTAEVVRDLTTELVGYEIDGVDPYHILKGLLKEGSITQLDFDKLWDVAHVSSLEHPIDKTVEFIRELPQSSITILTSRSAGYDPIAIADKMSKYLDKIVHVHCTLDYIPKDAGLCFKESSRAKASILHTLKPTITHFVDDLPFIHEALVGSTITPVFLEMPWSKPLAEETDLTFEDIDTL